MVKMPLHERLRDGTELLIRPIGPDDRDALRTGLERLSPSTRYRRFFSPVSHLSEDQLDYLTRIDHHDHEALAAVDEDAGAIVGVARYIRIDEDEAEPAIVVADDFQGRGVGSRLLTLLTQRAGEEGITRFRAPVLAHNNDAIAVLERLGETRRRWEGSTLELEIALDAVGPDEEPRSLLRLLRHAAEGTVSPGLTLLQRLAGLGGREKIDRDTLRDTIVVGTDGELGPAGREGARLARALGCSVQLVNARRPVLDDAEALDADLDRVAHALREQGIEVDVHVRRGTVAAALVDVAAEERARIIVVGASSRPHSPLVPRAIVSDSVAAQAPCDVLVVRGSGLAETRDR